MCSRSQIEKQRQDALAQDASVFDYDGVYDTLQSKKHEAEQVKEAKKQDRAVSVVEPSTLAAVC